MVFVLFALATCGGDDDTPDLTQVVPEPPTMQNDNATTDNEPLDAAADEEVAMDSPPDAIHIADSPNSAYLHNIIDILESRNFMIHYFARTPIHTSSAGLPLIFQTELHVFPENSMFAEQSATCSFFGGVYNHSISVTTQTHDYWLRMWDETYSVHELDEPTVPGIASWYETIFSMPIRFQGYTQSPVGDYEVYAISFGDDDRFTTLYLSLPVSSAENNGLTFLVWRFMGVTNTAEIYSFNTNPDRTLLTIEIPEHFERSN